MTLSDFLIWRTKGYPSTRSCDRLIKLVVCLNFQKYNNFMFLFDLLLLDLPAVSFGSKLFARVITKDLGHFLYEIAYPKSPKITFNKNASLHFYSICALDQDTYS